MEMKSLVKAVERFVKIDDKIHSRSNNASWKEIEFDAEEYTESRKQIILMLKHLKDDKVKLKVKQEGQRNGRITERD